MNKTYTRTKGEFEEGWNILHIDEARKQGFVEYFGPCAVIKEGHWIQDTLDDIAAKGRDEACVVKLPGSMCEIWIRPNVVPDAKPWAPLTYEQEDEDDILTFSYEKK